MYETIMTNFFFVAVNIPLQDLEAINYILFPNNQIKNLKRNSIKDFRFLKTLSRLSPMLKIIFKSSDSFYDKIK